MIDYAARIPALRRCSLLALLCQLLQGQEFACAFQAAEKSYAQEYHQSFVGNRADRQRFALYGKQAEDCVRFEADGLKISLPKDHPEANPINGVASDIVVKGDFELTVTFEVLQEPAPAGGRGKQTRFTFDIVLDKPGLNAASFSRTVYGNGIEFVAWSAVQKEAADKPKISMDYVPAKMKKGCLRLVRTGSELSYSESDGLDREFKLLRKHTFGTENLKTVRLVCSTGTPDASFDVRVTDLLIRADTIPDIPAPMPQGVPPEPDEPSKIGGRGWLVLLLALGLGLTLLLVLALGAWFYLRQRRQSAGTAMVQATKEEKHAKANANSPAVSVPCSGCGKNLKVKAESAGKKIKCPQCGKVVLIPNGAAREPVRE